MSPFFYGAETPWTDLGGGIRRKVVGHTAELMAVLVRFDKGAVGEVHSHDVHDQIAYVVSGSFEAEIDGVKRVLRAGDAFIAPRHCRHGVVALEADSTLLDQFSPCREDYL
ncbi:cupin domain-containing protein [Caldimonas tepidiphila]|uniref:cupin domain-containing protein n=1 Tax=Caldimonas tepidiphila TaxID=2315841 RepID=UPI000E5BA2C5|nr:cupin domain-containing protein [Caldimonas tepidiphila]